MSPGLSRGRERSKETRKGEDGSEEIRKGRSLGISHELDGILYLVSRREFKFRQLSNID